tara:strand:+ start:275 stop:874 length:600 start_codon:yes stop_codon:yes gene_type:complete
MLPKNQQERFTLIISELESKRVKKIDLHPKTLLKICKEMPILKQMWFNFKATEKDIINSNKRTLNLHCEYNITQRDFILLIKVLNNRKYLLEITPKQKSDLLDLIITLGGCEVIEKRIEYDEKNKKEQDKKQEILDMEYSAKTKRPTQDVKHRYSWKILMLTSYIPTNQENVRKIESDGYEFTEEITQRRMFFRKLRNK